MKISVTNCKLYACSGEHVLTTNAYMPADDTHLTMETVSDTTSRLRREGSNKYITVTTAGELKAIVSAHGTIINNFMTLLTNSHTMEPTLSTI